MTRQWTAECRWEDGWWIVEIPEAHNAATQARRLDQVAVYVTEVLKLMEGIDVDPADVNVHANVPGTTGAVIDMARTRREKAAVEKAAAEELTAAAAVDMRARGFTLRDIGTMLGISYQRAQQILTTASGGSRQHAAS